MEKEKPEVVFTPKASADIARISIYIEEQGYPYTAEKLVERMYDFGNSLSVFPNKYPLCRNKKFAKHGYHCAVFEKKYIFLYKVIGKQLIVFNVVHGRRISH